MKMLIAWPALAGIALPLFLVPTIILLRHSRLKRQWAHQERMEAIKRGIPSPPAQLTPGPGSIVAIGAGVPVVAVFCALLMTMRVSLGREDENGMLEFLAIIWCCTVLICGLAMATSLVLGVLQHRARAREAEWGARVSAKPAYDPDAFDVTGRHAY